MENEYSNGKTSPNAGSSKEGDSLKLSIYNRGDHAENKKSFSSSSASNVETSGSRRQSTRSIKPPKAFSPPLEHLKGSSKIKKGTNPNNGSKKPTTNAVPHNPSGNGNENRGRFALILYDLVEDTHKLNPSMISWSVDGKSFIMHPDHEDLEARIEEYYSRKFAMKKCTSIVSLSFELTINR